MIARLEEWWRARSARERALLRIAGALVLVLALFGAYQGAAGFRADAAAQVETARQIERDIARLAASGPPRTAPRAAGGLRELAMTNAQAAGLTVARIEQRGGAQRFAIALAPAPSQSVYRWIEAMGDNGALLRQTTLVRAGDGGQVSAEFEIEANP